MKRYKALIKEDFVSSSIERAIELTCSLVGKRVGASIYPTFIPDYVRKGDEGEVSGIIATVGSNKQIRFNLKRGSSSKILSIDIWNSISIQPDLTIEVEDFPITKTVEVIADCLKGNEQDEYVLEEDIAKTAKVKSYKDYDTSIIAWAKEMDVSDEKLEKTRVTDLYRDYQYWHKEVTNGTYKEVPFMSFRGFLINYMKNAGIKNIFTKTVKVKNAASEHLEVSTSEQKEFDSALYDMSLADKFEFLNSSILAVLRGYENALIISGQAGIGKSKTVRDVIHDEVGFSHVKWVQGNIKNFSSLYKLFYDNQSEDSIIVFDDADNVFAKKFISIMNASMAPEKKRIISYPAELDNDLPKGYKDEFLFQGKVLIITNLPKNKIPSSLSSRGAVIEMKTSKENMLDYIRINIDNVMTEYKQATKEIKLEVLDFIEKALGSIDQLDFRLYKRCCVYRLSGNPAWKKFCMPILKNM